MNDTSQSSAALSIGHERLILLFLLLLAGLFYLPGLNGPFLHDDFGRILNNERVEAKSLDMRSLLRSTEEYPERPLSMMTFAANHAACGSEPVCFKSTNVLLHLGTGFSLWLFLTQFTRVARLRATIIIPYWIPLAVTALWLLHPLNVSTVLYAVQRMTVLSTLFSLLAMTAWLYARLSSHSGIARMLWLLVACVTGALAILSKESGWLTIPFIALVELALMPDPVRNRIPWPGLLGWAAAAIGLFSLYMLAVFPPEFINRSYASRDYSPPERLFTESRILAYYASEILWPDPRRMSIFLDVFETSKSPFSPATTLAAITGCAVAIGASLAALFTRFSLVALGILFFFIAHAMESSVYGLILAYEHRNYMASMGLILACMGLLSLIHASALRILLLSVAAAGLALALSVRVQTWSTDENFIQHLRDSRWENSPSANIDIALHAQKMEKRHADDPYISGIYRKMAHRHLLKAADASSQPFVPLSTLLLHPVPATEVEAYWDRLDAAARDAPINTDALNATAWMATCLLGSDCPISRERFARYMDLMLANPRSRHMRWRLQRIAGTFFTRTYGQPEKGLELARKAAASGDVSARESLVKNLGYAGKTEEAYAEYLRLKSERPLGPGQIQRMEAAIASPGMALP